MQRKQKAGTPAKAKKETKKETKDLKKSDVTRQKIIAAARKVFARHSYHAASIRMIGTEGGFEHAIIRYYFPNKAELFKTVLSIISEEYIEKNKSWLHGLEDMSPVKGFSLYLDRFLDYNFNNPEVILILAQNLAQADKPVSMPGHEILTNLLAQNKRTFEDYIPLKASSEEISMFVDSFNALVFVFIGAGPNLAKNYGISPKGKKYRKYVKDSIMFVLLPPLTHLIFPDNKDYWMRIEN